MQPFHRDRTVGAVLAALLCAAGCHDSVPEPPLPRAKLVVPGLGIESCEIDGDGVYFATKGRLVRFDRSAGQLDELTSDVGDGTHRVFRQPGRTIWTENDGVYALADGAHVRTTIEETDRLTNIVAAVRNGSRICWARRSWQTHARQQIQCLGPTDSTPSTVRSGADVDGDYVSANGHLYTIRTAFEDHYSPMGVKDSHPVGMLFDVPLSDGDAIRIGEIPALTDLVATRDGLAWLTVWGSAQVLERGKIRSIEPRVPGGWERAWANGGRLWLLDVYGWWMEEPVGHLRRVLIAPGETGTICADDRSLYANAGLGVVEVRLDGPGT